MHLWGQLFLPSASPAALVKGQLEPNYVLGVQEESPQSLVWTLRRCQTALTISQLLLSASVLVTL